MENFLEILSLTQLQNIIINVSSFNKIIERQNGKFEKCACERVESHFLIVEFCTLTIRRIQGKCHKR